MALLLTVKWFSLQWKHYHCKILILRNVNNPSGYCMTNASCEWTFCLYVDHRLKNFKKTVLLLKLSKFGLVHSFAPDFFPNLTYLVFFPQLLYFVEETQTYYHTCVNQNYVSVDLQQKFFYRLQMKIINAASFIKLPLVHYTGRNSETWTIYKKIWMFCSSSVGTCGTKVSGVHINVISFNKNQ